MKTRPQQTTGPGRRGRTPISSWARNHVVETVALCLLVVLVASLPFLLRLRQQREAVELAALPHSAPRVAAPTPSQTPTPTPTPTAAPEPVVAFLGDTYTIGQGSTTPTKRWTDLVASSNQWQERNFGAAGTGYDNVGAAAGGQVFSDRVAAVAATSPAIVIVSGGRLDIAKSMVQEKSKVTATYQALREALPNARIIATSPTWPASTPVPANLAAIAGYVKDAVTAVGGTYLDIGQPLLGHPELINSDHVTPNDAGYAALAEAFEGAYKALPVP